MNFFLFLFCLATNKFHGHDLNKEKLDIESSKMDMLKGIDARNIDYKEPPIEYLIDLHEKRKRLLKLLNEDIPLFDREILAKEYLEEYNSKIPNLFAGNLLSDWEFEI